MSPRRLSPHVPSRVLCIWTLGQPVIFLFFPPCNSSPKSFDNSPSPTINMFIIERCWKKIALANSTLYEYQQQQYIFKSRAGPGLFYIVEVNTHHNSQMAKWPFPSFYRIYLGHLIYRWALYIKMWELQKSPAITSLPNLSMILKHLCHLASSFTDQVVEACLTKASQHDVVPTWVPKTQWEWLILKFHCGHGYNALAWLDTNKDEVPIMEPSEFS